MFQYKSFKHALFPEKKVCFWLRIDSQRSETRKFPSRELENKDESELMRFGGQDIGLELALCSISSGAKR